MGFALLLMAFVFIFCGVICGFAVGVLLGRRAVWLEVAEWFPFVDESGETVSSNAEILEETR